MAVAEPRVARGADVLVEALRGQGIDVVFGLPGVQLDAAFDALARRSGEIEVYTTRNEQATSYMAEGWTRVTGRPSCCLVVPGPGVLNAASGLASAYGCSTPVVCVAGQIDSAGIDRGLGRLHEIPGQLRMLASVTKWSARIESPERIGDVVDEAFAELRRGRPRPVAIEVPVDVLEAGVDGTREEGAGAGREPEPDQPDLGAIDAAAALLGGAERPLLVAGGGVLRAGAWDELRMLAERLRAPVVLSANGLGALPAEDPLAFTAASAGRLVAAADVILAAGTRFARSGGDRFRLAPGQRLIRIDADREEMTRDASPEIAIEGDARRPLGLLAEAVAPAGGGWRDLEAERDRARGAVRALQPQAAFGDAIRAALPDETVMVGGMTQVGYWSQVGFPVRRPRTYLGPGYQGALGFEVPTGLGAQVGSPGARVVVLAGDGGFMFNVQELATAVQYGIPAIFVVFDDGAYGNVKRMQRERFGRLIASELRNPDFVRLAESFGAAAMRAGGPDALREALGRALDVDGPVLIEVPVGEMPSVWPLLRSTT